MAFQYQGPDRRLKARKNYKAPRLENAEYSEADTQVVVLCGMSTLLSPQEIPSLSNTLNGQVPCEGYFIVVDVENPQIPLLEKGFIFLPEKRHYCQKKTALEDLSFRIRAAHGIDPEQRGLRTILQDRLVQTQGSSGAEHFLVTSELSELAKKVLEPVLEVVDQFKMAAGSNGVGSTCIFLTVNDSTELDNVKMGLKWLYAQQPEVRPFRCATFRINDLFPGVTDYVGHEQRDDFERARGVCNRCVMHPLTTVSSKYGKPYFCSKLFARRLWWAICDLEVASRDMDAGEATVGNGKETTALAPPIATPSAPPTRRSSTVAERLPIVVQKRRPSTSDRRSRSDSSRRDAVGTKRKNDRWRSSTPRKKSRSRSPQKTLRRGEVSSPHRHGDRRKSMSLDRWRADRQRGDKAGPRRRSRSLSGRRGESRGRRKDRRRSVGRRDVKVRNEYEESSESSSSSSFSSSSYSDDDRSPDAGAGEPVAVPEITQLHHHHHQHLHAHLPHHHSVHHQQHYHHFYHHYGHVHQHHHHHPHHHHLWSVAAQQPPDGGHTMVCIPVELCPDEIRRDRRVMVGTYDHVWAPGLIRIYQFPH